MQKAYINTLYDIVENDKNCFYLVADNGTDYDNFFMRDYPEQCFNVGISEQNMVGVAAGMVNQGKTVFITSNGPFLAYRANEFIRNSICLQKRAVKIAAFGCGLSISRLGATHHATEDIAVLRSFPGLLILSPASPLDVVRMTKFAYNYSGPVYLRIGMSGEKEIHNQTKDFELGECPEIVKGDEIAIFATGSIVNEAILAAKELEKIGVNIGVVSVTTLSATENYEKLKKVLLKYKLIFSLEEHSIYGGLGSIIAEVIAKEKLYSGLYTIGLENCFANGYGTVNDIRKNNNLDCDNIVKIIKRRILDESL